MVPVALCSPLFVSFVHPSHSKYGQNGYITPAVSGVPNTQRRGKIKSGYIVAAILGPQKRESSLHNPGNLRDSRQSTRGPKMGEVYITPTIAGVTNALWGDKIGSGNFSPAVLRANMQAKWLHKPCCCVGTPLLRVGTKS